ncbi:MAG TPA: hypothetical protein VJN89_07530 [Candidatus Acidoferrum sp.]|nr:hypothetical protein [Candidatus Acidoferrum sp.]
MGVWGTAIFSDDTACDIRDEYRDLVGDGHSGPAATDVLLEQWANETDKHEWGVFWLALAATQWKCGRLEERVKEGALQVIESGSDLKRWEEDLLIRKRQAALEKLRQQLLSPQPPARRIPKRFRDTCDWEVGELIGYLLKSGKWVILRVTGHHADRGGTSPTCELLRYVGARVPSAEQLLKLPVWKWKQIPEHSQLTLARSKERELPFERVKRLGIKGRPELHPREPIQVDGKVVYKCFDTLVLWRLLDRVLKEECDLE